MILLGFPSCEIQNVSSKVLEKIGIEGGSFGQPIGTKVNTKKKFGLKGELVRKGALNNKSN